MTTATAGVGIGPAARAGEGIRNRRADWESATSPILTVLAILTLVSLVGEAVWDIDSGWLTVFDWAVWAAFAGDYAVRLALSPGQRWWFVKSHPLDLAAVLWPALRVLRVVAGVGRLAAIASRGRPERLVITTAVVTVTVVIAAAAAVVGAERNAPDATITNFPDGVWWALTTVTTVGYGDLAPVTEHGRLIAAFLMVVGIAAMGSVTAAIASRLVASDAAAADNENDREIDALRGEIAYLTSLIENGVLAGLAATDRDGEAETHPSAGNRADAPRETLPQEVFAAALSQDRDEPWTH